MDRCILGKNNIYGRKYKLNYFNKTEFCHEVLIQLSVCTITKNEEKIITRCLSNLQPYDFEIVVVYTGSTDNTKKIAKSYTENVYDFSWCDDFTKAKNFAISNATNEFVMMIDSDEYLEPLEAEKLVQLFWHEGCVRRQVVAKNGGKMYDIFQ